MSNRFRFLCALVVIVLCPNFAPAASSSGFHDAAFREGWSLLQKERYAEARAIFAKIPPLEYDLGDYVVYFGGEAAAREGKRAEAGESLRLLEEKFPGSPLRPYLRHEVAYAAALDNDLPAARESISVSRGAVKGNGRKAEEGFVVALLAEE
ncbi:MAG: tetratricopeptide repeat protein, partial [Candidatus Deferrimicrobiaceae bacterium]